MVAHPLSTAPVSRQSTIDVAEENPRRERRKSRRDSPLGGGGASRRQAQRRTNQGSTLSGSRSRPDHGNGTHETGSISMRYSGSPAGGLQVALVARSSDDQEPKRLRGGRQIKGPQRASSFNAVHRPLRPAIARSRTGQICAQCCSDTTCDPQTRKPPTQAVPAA